MEETLEALKFLSKPFDELQRGDKGSWGSNPDALLEDIILRCGEKVGIGPVGKGMAEHCGPLTSSWKLMITALDLLLKIRDEVETAEKAQTEEEQGIEVLSIQGQMDVQKCAELVMGFGVLPYLLKDVGVPERVRKKNVAASEVFLSEDHRLLPLIKFLRLAQVIETLLRVCDHPSLSALIIPKHAADLLAALLQICNSPIAKPSHRLGSLTPEEYEYVMAVRKRFETHAQHFISSTVPTGILINSLFLIGEKPRFMREACAKLSQEVLLSPSGLVLISSTLLSEASPSNVWGLAKVVANIMRNSLECRNLSFESREMERLCNQCVKMIACDQFNESERALDENESVQMPSSSSPSSSGPFGINKELARIGLFCSLVLTDMDSQNTKAFVWDRLFKPVLDLGKCQRCETDNCEVESIKRNAFEEERVSASGVNEDIITSVDIERVIAVSEVTEGLLSLVIPSGVSIPLHTFQPLWSLLFHIVVACRKYLEKKVQEAEVSQLAQVLKNKLENVLILILEVVSSGAGEKLDLNYASCKTTGRRPGAPHNNANSRSNSVNTNNDNFPEEVRTKSVCDFCLQLLVNEHLLQKSGVNPHVFKLLSMSESESNLEQLSSPSSSCKKKNKVTVRIANECSKCERYDLSSGSWTHASSSKGNDTSETSETFEVLSEECVILCSLLKTERLSHIIPQFFRELLVYDENYIENQEDENSLGKEGGRKDPAKQGQTSPFLRKAKAPTKSSNQSPCSSSELTQLERNLQGEDIMKEPCLRKFVALKLLEELGGDEKTIETCVKTDDYKDTLLIVELVMRKLTIELKGSRDSGENYEFSQTILFALGFLGTIVETASQSKEDLVNTSSTTKSQQHPQAKTKKEEYLPSRPSEQDEFWNELQRFTPHLRIISEADDLGLISSGISAMAQNLLLSIDSRGKEGTKKVQVVMSEYEKALDDVTNPMLPIKGHGLLLLRRLIEAKDSETLKNDTFLLQLFQSELTSEDSYIYLMAVQGLAALGLRFHSIIIPILIQEYDFINSGEKDEEVGEGNGKRDKKMMYKAMTQHERIEFRMKIGEVLVKVIQQLGDMAPLYRIPLTNLYFRILRDDEPLIRASALSNLGELCHVLKFSLGIVLTEVWFNVESILTVEKEVHVRRAALHLLVLLLKGVEKGLSPSDLLSSTEMGEYLRDARRLLTRVQQQEVDVVAKTHAQLALQELELIIRKLFLSKPELNYKIRVLGLT